MSRFRITHHRSGIQYKSEYRATLEGAMKVARKFGWLKRGPHDPLCTAPVSAVIEERTGDYQTRYGRNYTEWERVATVSASGVTAEPIMGRPTVSDAKSQIDALKAQIARAQELADELDRENERVKAAREA